MSEEINKYGSGKIYKIWSPSREDLVYYGSTIEKLNRRLAGHKTKYALYKAGGKCSNTTSFKIFDGCSDYRIDLVLNYPCNSKEELNAKEGEYIKNNACVNKVVPCRTNKEYRLDNKEKEKARHKKYNDDHKEQSKQYRELNREAIKEQNKQYRELNKETINAQRREKYQANKDAYNAHRRELRLQNKNKKE